ncbi:MAG: DUF86 domain-containing protein [bacterium]
MVKEDVVRRHLKDLEQSIVELKKHQNRTEDDLRKDLSFCWSVEHGLQIAIQNMIDIGAHILSSDLKNDWNDYTEVIDKMGQYGMIPKKLSQKIRQFASLRNIIVHRYLDVNLSVIYDVLQNHLEDFKNYIAYIEKYLESKSQE